MFRQFFLVLPHLLFQLLDDAVQCGEHIHATVRGKEIICLLGRHAELDQGGRVVLQIDDHSNRGRPIKESRQALDLVANSLLNGVTQVTVLG